MFSIILLLCALSTGDITVILLVLVMVCGVWMHIISAYYQIHYQKTTKIKKQNKIDKHGDEIYGTIDWFYDGKI